MIGLCIERIQGVSKVLLTDRQNCRFLGLVFKNLNTQNSKLLLAGLEHILRKLRREPKIFEETRYDRR